MNVFDIIEKEEQRQKDTIELIASENFVSENVKKALGSCLTNKYCEGYLSSKFASLLESDKDLMYYLSYGTNGKANMVYVFKAIKELIINELK